jgi:hypothetical protein
MLTGLTTPGSRSSEFLVMVANAIAQAILAATNTVSDGTATKYGLAGAIAYVVSRGLAKYEARPGPNPPSPPA